MTTAWYYDHYKKGTFPHQQKLCEAVRGTKYNLDGQKQVSTLHFTRIATNPLTLRLRALQKALDQLKLKINRINAEIQKTITEQFNKGDAFNMAMRLHTQDSPLKTGGAAIEEITLPRNKTVILRHDTVHFALYNYFTNLGSILDRLAFEINMLYQLGDWVEEKLDWLRLTNPKDRFLCCLNVKDKNLAEFTQAQTASFKKVPAYRNRLIHDSIIHTVIEGVGFPREFRVFLPRDPNRGKTQWDVDAIEFCKKARADALKLLDGSYKLMLQHLQTHGKPPW